MLVLFLYVLWSISYLIISIIFKVFFLKKLLNKKSTPINLLLILYFNKNLSFYKNELSNVEYWDIISYRQSNYPTLNIIHEKVNSIYNTDNFNYTKFKDNYDTYKFLKKKNSTNVLDYSLQQNILKFALKYNYCNYLIVVYSFYKNSLSHETIHADIIYTTSINNVTNSFDFITNNKFKNIKLFKQNSINTLLYLTNLADLFSNKVNFNSFLNNQIISKFMINFSASNIVKYLSDLSVSKSMILFLRKNKIFNKSRYSRNRQTYRTGAYWCLYVNIIAVIAFYFWFYNFSINFSYIWWLLYSFILSFFFFKAIKFNFYNLNTLKLELISSVRWFYRIINSSLIQLYSINNFNLFTQKLIFILNLIHSNKINILFKIILNSVFKLNDYIYSKINK